MKTFRALALLGAAALCVSPAAANRKPNQFVPSDFDTPAKVAAEARRFWKPSGLRKIRGSGFQKVVIPEFTVEYVLKSKYDADGGGGFGLFDIAQAAGVGKKRMELDEATKQALPRVLHDAFVQQLVAAGYTVVPLEEVIAHPAFQKFKGHEDPDKTRSANRRGTSVEKGEVHSVEGLVDLREGAFAAISNVKTEAQLLGEMGADVSMRVHLRVGNVKGKPTYEDGSAIFVSAGPQQAGTGAWGASQYGNLAAKDGLMVPEDASSSKDFKAGKGKVITMDSAKYQSALLEMTHPFLGMALAILEQQP